MQLVTCAKPEVFEKGNSVSKQICNHFTLETLALQVISMSLFGKTCSEEHNLSPTVTDNKNKIF